MTGNFSQLTTHWKGFFTLTGVAAAMLVGLFTTENERQTRSSAERTKTNFFNILVLALMFNLSGWPVDGTRQARYNYRLATGESYLPCPAPF